MTVPDVELTDAYIAQIREKIARKTNGDVDEMILALVYASYARLGDLDDKMGCLEKKVEKNLAFQFGHFVRENRGLTAFLMLLVYLLTILIPEWLLNIVANLVGVDLGKLIGP